MFGYIAICPYREWRRFIEINTMIKKYLPKNPLKVFAICVRSLLFWLFFIYKYTHHLTFSDIGNTLLGFFQGNMRWPVLFMSFYAVRTLILFPAGITTIMGGVLFGPIRGCVFVFLWENASASIGRIVGRYFGKNIMPDDHKGIMKLIHSYLKWNDFISTLMLRLIPINFDMVNYACGIFWVKRKPYAIATAFGIIPGMVTYVLVGATFYGLTSLDFANIKLNTQYLLISLILYVVSFGLAFIVKKRMKMDIK
jgi:uncharacterized membrane protein YdjX (TVP38/TMEM64 family)